MTLRGILWNARGWRTKDAELIKQSRNYDILCVTKTKSRREDRLSIPGFATHVCNNYRQGEGGAGGVTIFIRHNIRSQFLNLSNIKGSFDIAGVHRGGENNKFSCCYM